MLKITNHFLNHFVTAPKTSIDNDAIACPWALSLHMAASHNSHQATPCFYQLCNNTFSCIIANIEYKFSCALEESLMLAMLLAIVLAFVSLAAATDDYRSYAGY